MHRTAQRGDGVLNAVASIMLQERHLGNEAFRYVIVHNTLSESAP